MRQYDPRSKVSLLDLPPELLIQALAFVGAAYFQEDGRRLLVCQHWFSCASTVFYQELHLNPATLRRLVQQPKALDRARNDTAFVSLTVDRQSESLDQDVRQLGITLQTASKARSLRLAACESTGIAAANVRTLLAIHLTDLDLDTRGIDLDAHVCHSIGALLQTLHHLKLRMRRLCPAVLTTKTEMLPLKDAIINLSLNDSHSRHCITGSVHELREQIVEQARGLSAVSSPRLLKVLWHSLPQFKLQSLNILNGKLETLADEAAWDDAGEEVVSEESESDISSLDSFDDV